MIRHVFMVMTALLGSPAVAEKSGTVVRPIQDAFAEKVVRIDAKPGVADVPIEWKFTNHWDFPLMIERFDQSCGCLSGRIESAKPVATGGTGSVKAMFAAGPHRGLVRKSLHVRFIGHEGSVELIAEAHIPSTVEFTAQELTWSRGSNTEVRSIEVTAGTNTPIHITSLSGVTSTHYSIALKTVVEGRHYRLLIKPTNGVSDGVKTLIVRTDSPDPRDRVKAVFLNMKPSADAAGDDVESGKVPPSP
jgi:hypothetical protein